MTRRTGAYESLIRGVSQQVPHDRLPGQHWAQDNFISDPVRGVARRHGSEMVDEVKWAGVQFNAATRDDARMYKETTLYMGGKEYSIMYRPGPKPAGSTMPSIFVIDKQEGKILPALGRAEDTLLTTLLDKGLSSVTSVGQFLLAAVKNYPTEFTQEDAQEPSGEWSINHSGVIWIKGGAYSRIYTVTYAGSDGIPHTVQYTTPASYYQGTLDTSDIPTSDEDYQKKVNDRVNEYNTAVNQHLAEASAAIQPAAIAEKLADVLQARGVTLQRQGATLLLTGVHSLTGDDGGNGDFMKIVYREVESQEDLTPRHLDGRVIKITPKPNTVGTSVSYYVKARALHNESFPEVVWEEAAGIDITPTFVFLKGYMGSDGLRLATSADHLSVLTGLEVPGFETSASGDLTTNPLPAFFGKPVTHLRTFQDRLVIVAGASVFMSKSGDYFNFFRDSVMALEDSDPIEIFAEGSEGDEITESVQNERNLFLFGRRQQYVIGGGQAITPESAFITVQSAHERANEAPPVSSGNLIFFTQPQDSALTLQQMQAGAFADSFESFDVTSQLAGYVHGIPRQVVAFTSPQQVFVRTTGLDNGLFVYTYLDTQGDGQRLYDSWSRWIWCKHLGQLAGVTDYESVLMTVTLRPHRDGTAWLVLDKFSRDSRLDDKPYLDSRRPYVGMDNTSIRERWPGADNTAVVMADSSKPTFLLGRELDEASLLITPENEGDAEVGAMYESVVDLTSPYIRDYKDRPILDGRLVISRLTVTVSDSAAMVAQGISVDREREVLNWVHRPVGKWVLDTQQIADSRTLTVPVMKEVRDYRMRLKSRNWLPLTLSAIEWTGQFFTSRRR